MSKAFLKAVKNKYKKRFTLYTILIINFGPTEVVAKQLDYEGRPNMNSVTYSIELTEANAGKIDAINQIMLGSTKTAPADTTSDKTTNSETKSKTSGKTVKDVKVAAKAAKGEHGEEFVKAALVSVGVEVPETLIKAINGMAEDGYAGLIAALEAGPKDDDGLGDDDDDGFGDDEDEANVDPEAVKTALKAYAKEKGRDKAKEIMEANGLKALSDVASAAAPILKSVLKALL